jgi:hypothetical protein
MRVGCHFRRSAFCQTTAALHHLGVNLMVVLAVSFASLVAAQLYYLPYYNMEANLITLQVQTVCLWAAVGVRRHAPVLCTAVAISLLLIVVGAAVTFRLSLLLGKYACRRS